MVLRLNLVHPISRWIDFAVILLIWLLAFCVNLYKTGTRSGGSLINFKNPENFKRKT